MQQLKLLGDFLAAYYAITAHSFPVDLLNHHHRAVIPIINLDKLLGGRRTGAEQGIAKQNCERLIAHMKLRAVHSIAKALQLLIDCLRLK